MPKQTTHLPLILPRRGRGQPAARWLLAGVRAAILEGRLRPGARLPSTRDLALHHGLSRGTVVSAFEQLAAEGYVAARVGAGTRVTAVLPDSLLEVADPARKGTAATAGTAMATTAATLAEAAAPPAAPALGVRPPGAPFPGASDRPRPRLPHRPAGAGPLPHDAVGAGRVSPAAPGVGEPPAGLRTDGLPAAAGSGGGLPDRLARRPLRPRAGRHRLRCAGSARPRGAAAAESRRPGGHRGPGIPRRGPRLRGARRGDRAGRPG